MQLHLNPITFHPEKETSLAKQSHLSPEYWNALLSPRKRSLAEVQIFIQQLNECGIEVTLAGHLAFIALTSVLDKRVLEVLVEQNKSMTVHEIQKMLTTSAADFSHYEYSDVRRSIDRLSIFYYATKEEDEQKNLLSAKITPVGRSYRYSLMEKKEPTIEQIEIPIIQPT